MRETRSPRSEIDRCRAIYRPIDPPIQYCRSSLLFNITQLCRIRPCFSASFTKKVCLGARASRGGHPQFKRGDSFQAATMSPFFGDRWAIIITSFLDITPVARPSTTWSIHQHRTHALKIQGFKVDRAETSGLRQIGVNPMSCCSAVIAHGSPPSAPPVRMSPNCCQSTGRALSNIFLSPLPLPARANNDEARPMMEGEGARGRASTT